MVLASRMTIVIVIGHIMDHFANSNTIVLEFTQLILVYAMVMELALLMTIVIVILDIMDQIAQKLTHVLVTIRTIQMFAVVMVIVYLITHARVSVGNILEVNVKIGNVIQAGIMIPVFATDTVNVLTMTFVLASQDGTVLIIIFKIAKHQDVLENAGLMTEYVALMNLQHMWKNTRECVLHQITVHVLQLKGIQTVFMVRNVISGIVTVLKHMIPMFVMEMQKIGSADILVIILITDAVYLPMIQITNTVHVKETYTVILIMLANNVKYGHAEYPLKQDYNTLTQMFVIHGENV